VTKYVYGLVVIAPVCVRKVTKLFNNNFDERKVEGSLPQCAARLWTSALYRERKPFIERDSLAQKPQNLLSCITQSLFHQGPCYLYMHTHTVANIARSVEKSRLNFPPAAPSAVPDEKFHFQFASARTLLYSRALNDEPNENIHKNAKQNTTCSSPAACLHKKTGANSILTLE
jgi:hypothetical protein